MWFKADASIYSNVKVYNLAEDLNIPHSFATGILTDLWAWVTINAPDGDISGYSERTIARIVDWRKSALKLYEALVVNGFIDVVLAPDPRNPGKQKIAEAHIHNWTKRQSNKEEE